ncbi:alpha/beta-hydrolase [Vararia minispora EC-137]|uniref:Alpha/beta-hydrolase n=1 Tax=Vararia minispora EC-137 TaxID=1314806 RepID=A0ACB8QVX0_9AGAM|nr:alpha/beta-hydrolase [Vararia minispora EC-137]
MAAAVATESSYSVLPHLPPSKEIPATFGQSFKHWWAVGDKGSAASEERLLRRVSSYRPASQVSLPSNSTDSDVISYSERVTLSNPKHWLNMFAMKPTAPKADAPPPAVVLHGYGAGLGFFFLNFPTLAKWAGARGTPVYALDWLGMGRSARPPFRIKAKRTEVPERVAEAESFFLDALEEWRQKMGLEKMTLVGHSLGGYLSVAYALRYPDRVSKLVLLSPVGVPHDPDSTESPDRELTDDQHTGSEGPQAGSTGRVEAIKQEQAARKRQPTRTMKFLMYLWEEGWSPFQIVRSTVFWGPMLVGRYSSRRFGSLDEEETRDIHDYLLNLTLMKGSGEYCISHLLAPGAHARLPLVDRIAALKIPVTFAYGEHDWMDPEGGQASIDNMRKAGNYNGKMYVVPKAGHHLYMDNASAVNTLLVSELDYRP